MNIKIITTGRRGHQQPPGPVPQRRDHREANPGGGGERGAGQQLERAGRARGRIVREEGPVGSRGRRVEAGRGAGRDGQPGGEGEDEVQQEHGAGQPVCASTGRGAF